MKTLMITVSTRSDCCPKIKTCTYFKFDFEHDAIEDLIINAAQFLEVIAEDVILESDCYFFYAETRTDGDTTETWDNHGHAAIMSLFQYFSKEDQKEITDLAIDLLSRFNSKEDALFRLENYLL